MIVHLVDGTYELFRHFYGLRRFTKGTDRPLGAVVGVLQSVLEIVERGETHVGVATDHIIESFRNDLWPGYKTSAGIEPALFAQFHPLEEALVAMGVVVWPMVELEADDALAAAARVASADDDVVQVRIWTPDKDLAQCVSGDRVVQVDRRNNTVRNAGGVREKFGVEPERIPDLLALVGDSADGIPGLPGFGQRTAAVLLGEYGHLEHIPADPLSWRVSLRGSGELARILAERREEALLYRTLATLRLDAPLPEDLDALAWHGADRAALAALCARMDDPELLERVPLRA